MTYQPVTNFSQHRTHWQDWLNLGLAMWLFLSPWILGFAGMAGGSTPFIMSASWNAWILGAAVFVVSLGSLNSEERWPEWINLVLGVWIFLAPWILGFQMVTNRAGWDHWIVGAAIVVLAICGASTARFSGPRANA
jgi:hypothetical protein